MNDVIKDKLAKLREILRKMDSVLVSFSGGVDSAFLLKAAMDELGVKNVVGMIAKSAFYPAWMIAEARCLGENIGAKIIELDKDILLIPQVRDNAPDRCYHCKREMLGAAISRARSLGLKHVVDGTNADDVKEYRPGRAAAEELGVRSPLLEAGFTKSEIREAGKTIGIPNWDNPSYTCLATRFPTGAKISAEKLNQVAVCEDVLRDEGFRIFRVRSHGNLARIEIDKKEIGRLFENKGLYEKVTRTCRSAGYKYVTLDMNGYQPGSTNEIPSGSDDKK